MSAGELDPDVFLSLESLARRAAYDSMGAKGAPRDGIGEDQFDALSCHLLAVGIRAFRSYDRERSVSEGDAFNHAYRSMRGYRGGRFTEGPYIDWLRTNIRDSRFEPETTTSVTASGELPETAGFSTPESFDQAILDASSGLSNRALLTLHEIARPMVERELTQVALARETGIPLDEIRARMDELRCELGLSTEPTNRLVGELEAA